MTQEQIESLSEGFKKTKVYNELTDKQQEFINDLEGLQQGLADLSDEVHTGFKNGKVRMDGIEIKVDKVDAKVDKLETSMKEFIITQNNEIKEEIRNDKLKKLEDKIDKKDKEIQDKQNWINKLKYGALYLTGTLLIGYILWTLQVGGKS